MPTRPYYLITNFLQLNNTAYTFSNELHRVLENFEEELVMEKNLHAPSLLNDVPYQKILFKYSDIKRLLNQIRLGKNEFKVRIRRDPPIAPNKTPIKAFDDINHYQINDIDAFLNGKSFRFMRYDSWDGRFKQIPKKEVPSQVIELWEKYRQDMKAHRNNINNDVIERTINTTVADYLNACFRSLKFERQDTQRKLRDAWGKINWNEWKIKHPENSWVINQIGTNGSILALQSLSPWDSLEKQIQTIGVEINIRKLRRSIPNSCKRISFIPTNQFIIQFTKRLYTKLFKEEWPKRRIFFSKWSNEIEWSDNPEKEVLEIHPWKSPRPTDLRIQIPPPRTLNPQEKPILFHSRLIDSKLVFTCHCCDRKDYWTNMYVTHDKGPAFEWLKAIKAFWVKQTEELRQPKRTLLEQRQQEKKENLDDLTIISNNIKAIIEAKKAGINNDDDNEPLAPITLVQFSNEYRQFIIGIKNNSFFICHSCNVKIWNRHNRLMMNEDRQRGPFIKNYTDDPLKHLGFVKFKEHHVHRTAKGESPNLTFRNFKLSTGKITREVQDKTLYMGIELEVLPSKKVLDLLSQTTIDKRLIPYQSRIFASTLVNEFLSKNKIGILKHDASIQYGFELVTVPGTHAWHTKEAWLGFFKEDYPEDKQEFAPTNYLTGWINNGDPRKDGYQDVMGRYYPFAGIHIHVSRDAFQPLQLSKLITFINAPENRDFMVKIAGRDNNEQSRYVAKGKLDKTSARFLRDGRLFGFQNRAREGIREAINLNTNTKPTVEFRLFRSNIAKAGFMKNIDFIHSLILWSNSVSIQEKDRTLDNYLKFAQENKGTYKWLNMWLIKNKYFKEPVYDSSKYKPKSFEEAA